MTELGIPVFNTPGANANAVKELVLCGLFLGSRRVIDGINHMKQLGADGLARERVEKDKSMFGGREIAGKTLAVVGLGHIGSSTVRDAAALGMKVIGYDPALNVQSALKLPKDFEVADSIASAVSNADYIRYVQTGIVIYHWRCLYLYHTQFSILLSTLIVSTFLTSRGRQAKVELTESLGKPSFVTSSPMLACLTLLAVNSLTLLPWRSSWMPVMVDMFLISPMMNFGTTRMLSFFLTWEPLQKKLKTKPLPWLPRLSENM